MKHKGPFITLAAGVLLAAVLLVLDLFATSNNGLRATGASASSEPTAVLGSTRPPAPTTAATTAPPAAAPPNGTYAGAVDGGSRASVAIAVKGGKAVAYVCDGRNAEAWLQGEATGGKVNLTGAGKAALTASYANNRISGKVTAAGHTWTFTIATVAPPSGLYRAAAQVRSAKVVGGWIVLPDGSQVGIVDVDGTPVNAPPLNTGTLTTTVNDTTVTAAAVDGTPLELGQ